MWVLIATMWIISGTSVNVNVITRTYADEIACEVAKKEWQPPTNPPMTWSVQCKKMDGNPTINLNING